MKAIRSQERKILFAGVYAILTLLISARYPQTIEPAQISDQFYGDYRPKNIPGKSKIMYVFFDVDNRNDSVAVMVEYNASPASAGDDLAGLVKFSGAYPNPAVNMVNVDYSIPASVNKASITITNMLGCKVKEVKLDSYSGKSQIDVSELINGIYFYSLIADDQLILNQEICRKALREIAISGWQPGQNVAISSSRQDDQYRKASLYQ